jgi:hypothetical protein
MMACCQDWIGYGRAECRSKGGEKPIGIGPIERSPDTATLVGGDSLTSVQIAPSTTKKVPFMTPSRCAESPIRMLVKRVSSMPVTRPSRNKNMPCHINRRFAAVHRSSPFSFQ